MNFRDFLLARIGKGAVSTEDTLATLLPLFRQVLDTHAAGRVAPLRGLNHLRIEGVRAWFEAAATTTPASSGETRRLDPADRLAFEIVDEGRSEDRVGDGAAAYATLRIAKPGQQVIQPVYLPGYSSWEHEIGHHDPVTDVFSLGLLLASLALGLDLDDPDDLEQFVVHRGNLFDLNPDLHPVVAKAIARMTELSRHRRAQDLAGILASLENYRDQAVDVATDLTRAGGLKARPPAERRRILLERLRERLFEVSRRNRLLYHRPTLNSLNLTVASVPLLFDVRAIRPEQLLTWQPDFAKALLSGEPIPLGRYLRFEDAPYITGALDHILAETRRDQNEYGFSQLRLVLCFLRWHNLKEAKDERIETPLVLLPVQLSKRKGVRDVYVMQATATEAEVNPTLRYHLRQIYGIRLPESLDLTKTPLEEFHATLSAQIQASEPGVTLNRIDRPHIRLIHEKAKRRLDQYQRRLSLQRRGRRSFQDLSYSYDRENFAPLGLQLFRSRVRPSPAALGDLAEHRARPLAFAVPDAPTDERERNVAEFQSGGATNPYSWDFDLCSITLGNFRYRKMSLVRDYDALLDREVPNAAFEAIFSLAPRRAAEPPAAPAPLEQRHPVVACDPTQASAIAQAGSGRSFIIQGPPGTGKSQTITNLIADYVAAGRRVLFVCEKRAAIDVVYQRLKQQGLHELCCLIHDSQEDKKAFVLDLKQTYETFLAESGMETVDWPARRDQVLAAMKAEFEPIRKFEEAMESAPDHVGLPLRLLLRRRIELAGAAPEARTELPPYRLWHENRDSIGRLAAALGEVEKTGVLSRHPLSLLSGAVLKSDSPPSAVDAALGRVRRLLSDVTEAAAGLPRLGDGRITLADLAALAQYARSVRFLSQRGLCAILDSATPAHREFAQRVSAHTEAEAALSKAREVAPHWRERPPKQEALTALDAAKSLGGFFSFLKPAWWRLRGVLNARYDFSKHVVRPTWVRILEGLVKEYEAEESFAAVDRQARDAYRLDGPLREFARQVLQLQVDAPPGLAGALHPAVVRGEVADDAIAKLEGLRPALDELGRELDGLLALWKGRAVEEISDDVDRIEEALDLLPAFLPVLAELQRLPDPLAEAFRRLPVDPAGLEAGMADRGFAKACLDDRHLARFTAPVKERHRSRLEKLHGEWHEANAGTVRSRVRDRFLKHAAVSSRPTELLTAEERTFKKVYAQGRKELEHEFGKTMRYRSIRDLLQDPEAGRVIPDLKPVWLMSPLSVSDTLPLDSSLLDVVIFDEASQIPLEEGLPAVFRANQCIVVGDQMQLPPTSFFASKADDDPLEDGEEAPAEYDLAGNSFLSYADRTLPSTMLGWHYRSRSESLISFSNSRFYDGRLYTVPESARPASGLEAIRVRDPKEGAAGLARALERSVSFHFLETGVYEDRRNPAEAAYIAETVRALLKGGSRLSVGVVAFSEAQQGQIESALDALARDDAEFRDLLEREVEREEDGQYLGLLVKNLENVQGDERDLVILSVCYGRGPDGRMLMNFGPINQSGGEKRLNVAFSRAKRHMMIVSSIHGADITNEYNDGANCLRNYLRYAEAVSSGDERSARRILDEISVRREARESDGPPDPLGGRVAEALREKGYEVDLRVGQSKLRCDLAVRRPGESRYLAAVLLDTGGAERTGDLLSREVMKPGLLRAFGWRVYEVLAKDWHQDRAGTLDRLDRFLRGDLKGEATDGPVLPPPPTRTGAPPEPSPPAASAPLRRRFEFVEGASRKFWEISADGPRTRVRFGRIGTGGQELVKDFASPAEAVRDAERLIREKLAKGYVERA